MNTKLFFRCMLLGFVSWLIPFAVSFLFFKPGGELMVPYSNFKTIIMLVGVISGCYLLFLFFKPLTENFTRLAVIAGFSWFAINIILDIVLLVPMMKTTVPDYFISIGLGYFSIPVISITIGYLLDKKTKSK